jgi:SOS-response transcriptional repressor LexA
MSFIKNSVGERIRKLREEKNFSQQELALLIPISQAALHRLETGESSKSGKLVDIAQALGTTAEYLQTGKGFINHSRNANKIPILKWTEIKKWIDSDEDNPLLKNEERAFIYPPKNNINSKGAYALKIEGDSMQYNCKDSLNVGDYVIVDPEKKEKSGDIIIYNSPDYNLPIIRKLNIENKNYLIPFNKDYKLETINDISLSYGVVVLKVSIFCDK